MLQAVRSAHPTHQLCHRSSVQVEQSPGLGISSSAWEREPIVLEECANVTSMYHVLLPGVEHSVNSAASASARLVDNKACTVVARNA